MRVGPSPRNCLRCSWRTATTRFSLPRSSRSSRSSASRSHRMSKRLDYHQIAPAGVKALGGVYSYIVQSSLSPVLVDLAYLRVSQINNCAYCLDMHTRDLLNK